MEKYSKHVPQYPIRDYCLQKMKNLVFIIKNLDWNADNYFITNHLPLSFEILKRHTKSSANFLYFTGEKNCCGNGMISGISDCIKYGVFH